jgi:hypothetical protein
MQKSPDVCVTHIEQFGVRSAAKQQLAAPVAPDPIEAPSPLDGRGHNFFISTYYAEVVLSSRCNKSHVSCAVVERRFGNFQSQGNPIRCRRS